MIFAYPVFVLCSMYMLVSILKDRYWAVRTFSRGGCGSFQELHPFPSAYGNRLCHMPLFNILDLIASHQEWWTVMVTSGTCCLSWCWAPGLLPESCSSHFCLLPQLIPDSIVALWLFTLAQELLSHFRCWEDEGSTWARFLHASVPHKTGRQDHILADGHRAV